MRSDPLFFVGNDYTPQSKASISVLDLACTRGYGLFDYLRTYQNRPFHLEAHLKRFELSAASLFLKLPKSLEEIGSIIQHLIYENNFHETQIRIMLTGGISEDDVQVRSPTLIITARPIKEDISSMQKEGIHTITTPLQRILPSCKSLQYLTALLALKEAKKQNAKEAIYLSKENHLLETTMGNLFAIMGNTLITPSEGILKGVTREIILKLAAPSFNIDLCSISKSEIGHFDEMFFTSSSKELVPILSIDKELIGKGVVGEKTSHLLSLFKEYTKKKEWNLLD